MVVGVRYLGHQLGVMRVLICSAYFRIPTDRGILAALPLFVHEIYVSRVHMSECMYVPVFRRMQKKSAKTPWKLKDAQRHQMQGAYEWNVTQKSR